MISKCFIYIYIMRLSSYDMFHLVHLDRIQLVAGVFGVTKTSLKSEEKSI